jgi:hypothetical protein
MKRGAVLVLLLAGCAPFSYEEPQTVTGSLTVDGKPIKSGQVRLVEGENPSCDNAAMSAAVSEGRFELRRDVEYGRFDVVVQEDALCILEGKTWVKAWHGVYGPASPTLVFSCTKQGQAAWVCLGNDMETHFK